MSTLMTNPAVTRSLIVLNYDLFDEWQARLNNEFFHEPEIDRILAFAQHAIVDSVLEVIGKLHVDDNGTLTFLYQPSAVLLAAAKVADRGDLVGLCRTLRITEASVVEEAKEL